MWEQIVYILKDYLFIYVKGFYFYIKFDHVLRKEGCLSGQPRGG